MFVGHAAVALAAKTRTPELSLGWLIGATYLLDLLWPVFLLIGIEQVTINVGATAFTPLVFDSYPWSHSLLMACAWGLLAAVVAHAAGVGRGASAVLGLVVISHWVLDWVTHAPDLPLAPWPSPQVGLGLWDSIAATVIIEGALLAAAIVLYLRHTKSIDRVGSVAFWAFIAFCVVIWLSGPWSPPPPSSDAIAWVGISGWLLVAWAAWFDRHRRSTAPQPSH